MYITSIYIKDMTNHSYTCKLFYWTIMYIYVNLVI